MALPPLGWFFESKFFVSPSSFTSFSLPRGAFYCDDFLFVRADNPSAVTHKNHFWDFFKAEYIIEGKAVKGSR